MPGEWERRGLVFYPYSSEDYGSIAQIPGEFVGLSHIRK